MRSCRNVALRRVVPAVLISLLFGCEAHAGPPPAPPTSDAQYWAFADRVMQALDSRWSERRRAYAVGSRTASVRENSAMLHVHAVAALERHSGPTRQDRRARILAERLSATPAWLAARPLQRANDNESTCWSLDMDRPRGAHASLESKTAAALALAWRARRQLGLSGAVARRIERRVLACATSPVWNRGPRVENQINWNAELYASAVTVSRQRHPLVVAYRRQLAAFAGGITRPMAGQVTQNLGRAYQFHYRPEHPDGAPVNLDSPEYANITFDAVSHYERALRLGMRPLSDASVRRVRAWTTRLLAGAWTHAGYLNWDTGHGVKRWHSSQYWAFAQQGLLAIATSPRLRTAEQGRWAKAMFDRGLQLYRRLADERGRVLAPTRMYGVRSLAEYDCCFHQRTLTNVARAIHGGLGSMPADEPPPLYSFDYDTGRLAITTPSYSTAIVPENRGVFAYGGIEPARLHGGDGSVLAGVGGTPPAAFGIVVSDRRGRMVLASQRTRAGRVRLTRTPHGSPLRPKPYPMRPYAGPFGEIEAEGVVSGGGVRIHSTHTFRRATIDSRWRVECARSCGERRLRAYLPTWGRQATIDAIGHDGTPLRLAGAGSGARPRVPVAGIAALVLRGESASYRVVGLRAPAGSALSITRPRATATNPSPGPSVVVTLPRSGRPGARLVSIRLEPLA